MPSDLSLSPPPTQSPPTQSRRALLRILDLDVEPSILFLDRPVLQIGRARETCNLVLTGPGISAHHCCLRREGERWLLRDRGSLTGTHVNNRRCHEPTLLHDGDRISVGLHLLEFRTAPSLALSHTLTRLRDAAIDLQFNLDAPSCAPAPVIPRTPSSALLRSTALGAAAALALTLGVAANIAAAPPTPPPTAASRAATPQSSYMSPETSTAIISDALDQPVNTIAPAAPDERAEYLAEPPAFELPADAIGRGRPDAGALVHALALPPSPDYTIRCPAHAHASSTTVAELMLALASFRNRSDYHGELVVGDLSQHTGGRYGPHRSHQSGRDVDLWLPVRGGRYRRGCVHCGTDLCRPSPREVDWSATWQLIQALASRGAAQDIFLDWSLQPALRAAAGQRGAPTAQLERQIQHPVRGRAALVKHAAGHIHHLHVRFRCPAHDPDCIATP